MNAINRRNITQEALLGMDLKVESDPTVIEQVTKDLDGVYDFSHFNMGDR
jgi:hypothetical protein